MLDEKKIAENYDQGYQEGLAWPDAWENHGDPGGPYIYRGQNTPAMAAQTLAENKAWREGWKKGHEIKISTGRSNPKRK